MSETNTSASNIRVLVTRPKHQSAGFIDLLQKHGLHTVHLPTIKIDFVDADIQSILNSDLIIFTSVNSVLGADRCLSLPWNIEGRKTAAIGKATAKALTKLNSSVDIVPVTTASSEALLDAIDDVAGISVTIIRGDHGREALHDVLTTRGASVKYLTVYRRTLPIYSESELDSLFNSGLPDITSVTSDYGLGNLLQIIPPALKSTLLQRPLVVNSKRCATIARDCGFENSIVVSDPPGDESQATEISRLARL